MILTHGVNSLKWEGTEIYGDFLLLNNCDTVIDNHLISLAGPNFNWNSNIFSLDSSSVYANANLVKMRAYDSANGSIASDSELNWNYDKITFETYFSNYSGAYNNISITEVSFGGILSFECQYGSNRYRIEIWNYNNAYQVYNGAVRSDLVGSISFFLLPIYLSNSCHIAAVLDKINGYIYIFGNGVLYVKCSVNTQVISNKVSFNRETYPVYIGVNFISIRKGDFSNNLESFTVPTQKYTL